MVTSHPGTELAIRNLTLDYSSGHALIDGRPIGTFVAEQGPEVLASPAPDQYIVNVPLLVKSVTFLPSGEHSTTTGSLNDAWRIIQRFVQAAQGSSSPARYTADEVRLALAQSVPERTALERIMTALDEVAP